MQLLFKIKAVAVNNSFGFVRIVSRSLLMQFCHDLKKQIFQKYFLNDS